MPENMQDIRLVKRRLRQECLLYRERLDPAEKARLENKIANKVFNLWSFRESGLVLSYVAKPLEVDTRPIILGAFERGKNVAVPRCIPGTLQIEFLLITSLDDLRPGAYGIAEPDPDRCRPLPDAQRSICIVPALAFDAEGYRLGFGKGYFDRFLSAYKGVKAGICFDACVLDKLPRGKYDKQVDFLLTESRMLRY